MNFKRTSATAPAAAATRPFALLRRQRKEWISFDLGAAVAVVRSARSANAVEKFVYRPARRLILCAGDRFNSASPNGRSLTLRCHNEGRFPPSDVRSSSKLSTDNGLSASRDRMFGFFRGFGPAQDELDSFGLCCSPTTHRKAARSQSTGPRPAHCLTGRLWKIIFSPIQFGRRFHLAACGSGGCCLDGHHGG